jgi:salicylate hydroxylase
MEAESTPRVSVLFGAQVIDVDCDACSVTLHSGQICTGDAILGADGAYGVVRRTLMKENDMEPESDIPTGTSAYRLVSFQAREVYYKLKLAYQRQCPKHPCT